MHLLYLANIRFPTEKAHGAQIVKMCEAFARRGAKVTLAVSGRKTPITEDPYTYYGVKNIFRITRIFVPDTIRFGAIGFIIHAALFSIRSIGILRAHNPDVVYGRDELPLLFASFAGFPIVWESHTGRTHLLARLVANRAKNIVVISEGLATLYRSVNVPEQKIIVAHDGVDLEQFSISTSSGEARKLLGVSQDARVAMYVGALEEWKGYRTFLEASTFLPNMVFVVIGGSRSQISALSQAYPTVVFIGTKPYKDLPRYQRAADILVVPNTMSDVVSSTYTSPLKVFAYMTSEVPIVASDVPSIREVLDEQTAYFFEPDQPKKLAEKIAEITHSPNEAAVRALQARKVVEHYTWDARANTIMSVIEKK